MSVRFSLPIFVVCRTARRIFILLRPMLAYSAICWRSAFPVKDGQILVGQIMEHHIGKEGAASGDFKHEIAVLCGGNLQCWRKQSSDEGFPTVVQIFCGG